MLRLPVGNDPLLGRPFALYDTVLNKAGEPIAALLLHGPRLYLAGNALAQLIRKRRKTKRRSLLAAMFAFDRFSHSFRFLLGMRIIAVLT